MATKRITKRNVDALRCENGKDRTFLWDDALAGFGVAAFPSGKNASDPLCLHVYPATALRALNASGEPR